VSKIKLNISNIQKNLHSYLFWKTNIM